MRDLYTEVTDTIVAALETASSDCVMPWDRSGASSMPVNIETGNAYQGINTLNLWCVAMNRGYRTTVWGTYQQWQHSGCQVRKGEKASQIIFYKEVKKEGDDGEEKRRVLRGYSVFNAEQVEGFTVPEKNGDPIERLEHVETVIRATGADIRIGGAVAAYHRGHDHILMPDEERFYGQGTVRRENWYSVLWHELGHFTGHPSRLNREMGKRFGDDAYAMEELVAELTAAFCCADLGITKHVREDHASYLKNWLTVLKGDKKAVFYAAARAQEAVQWLLKT
jgi:antirestriction protein ArdC